MPIAPNRQNPQKLVVEARMWHRQSGKPHLVMQTREGPKEVKNYQEARDYAAAHQFSGITVKEV